MLYERIIRGLGQGNHIAGQGRVQPPYGAGKRGGQGGGRLECETQAGHREIRGGGGLPGAGGRGQRDAVSGAVSSSQLPAGCECAAKPAASRSNPCRTNSGCRSPTTAATAAVEITRSPNVVARRAFISGMTGKIDQPEIRRMAAMWADVVCLQTRR